MTTKVDVAGALQGLSGPHIMWHPEFDIDPVTHAPYRREPYMRARFVSSDGAITAAVDGKATAWTREHVLFHWVEAAWHHREVWLQASEVRRITREESSWTDPYDLL